MYLVNVYNLIIQLEELNDVRQPQTVFKDSARTKGWSLDSIWENHPFRDESENFLLLILSMMSQFDIRVLQMTGKALKENFLVPAGSS